MQNEVVKGSVVVVKKFLDSGTAARIGMAEMQEFWKSISEAEKLQFTVEAISLMPELGQIAPTAGATGL